MTWPGYADPLIYPAVEAETHVLMYNTADQLKGTFQGSRDLTLSLHLHHFKSDWRNMPDIEVSVWKYTKKNAETDDRGSQITESTSAGPWLMRKNSVRRRASAIMQNSFKFETTDQLCARLRTQAVLQTEQVSGKELPTAFEGFVKMMREADINGFRNQECADSWTKAATVYIPIKTLISRRSPRCTPVFHDEILMSDDCCARTCRIALKISSHITRFLAPDSPWRQVLTNFRERQTQSEYFQVAKMKLVKEMGDSIEHQHLQVLWGRKQYNNKLRRKPSGFLGSQASQAKMDLDQHIKENARSQSAGATQAAVVGKRKSMNTPRDGSVNDEEGGEGGRGSGTASVLCREDHMAMIKDSIAHLQRSESDRLIREEETQKLLALLLGSILKEGSAEGNMYMYVYMCIHI